MTKRQVSLVVTTVALLGALFIGQSAAQSLQPQVTIVEKGKEVHGSISMDKGSPWCRSGQRMVWLVGHDRDEHPSCEVQPGVWKENRQVTLPLYSDRMNRRDDRTIDRHDCKPIYANRDDIPDIICLVGANKGRGVGFNELFITQSDGSLRKVEKHGLQKYITMRTRMMNVLRGPKGEQLVFISVRGTARRDGRPNVHRMFRVTRGQDPFFVEVEGPWRKATVANAVVVGDIDGNGLDDVIVTNEKDRAFMFIQKQGYQFESVNMEGTENWRNARIEDVTGDGIVDLVVSKYYRWTRNTPWLVQVFEGTGKAPYFDLDSPYYELELDYPSAYVEVLDVDGDGWKDIYVVQADEATNNYCGNKIGEPFNPRRWYGTNGTPRKGFVAPTDKAPDLLLVGTGTCQRFKVVKMNHRVPGCGFLAEKFGNDQTMILSHGEIARAGHNVILEWERKSGSQAKRVPECASEKEPEKSEPDNSTPDSSAPENSKPDTSKPDTSDPGNYESPSNFDPIVVMVHTEIISSHDSRKNLSGINGYLKQDSSGLLYIYVNGLGVVWSNGYESRDLFYYTTLQADGNLVTRIWNERDEQLAVWDSGDPNQNSAPYTLVINSRKTIAVVNKNDKVIWQDRLIKEL